MEAEWKKSSSEQWTMDIYLFLVKERKVDIATMIQGSKTSNKARPTNV